MRHTLNSESTMFQDTLNLAYTCNIQVTLWLCDQFFVRFSVRAILQCIVKGNGLSDFCAFFIYGYHGILKKFGTNIIIVQ